MQSSTDRSAKYDLKYSPATVGLKVAAQLADMKVLYAAQANAITAIEISTSACLNTQGVKSAVRGPYYSYTRELWKKSQLEAGSALDDDAQEIKDKWVARGLDSGVCIAIALVVHALVVT